MKLICRYPPSLNKGSLIDGLYAGMPCTNCGKRFTPVEMENRNVHLDWHFKVNIQAKAGGVSRKLYVDI